MAGLTTTGFTGAGTVHVVAPGPYVTFGGDAVYRSTGGVRWTSITVRGPR